MALRRPLVDLWFDSDCPRAQALRELLLTCLRQEGGQWEVREHLDCGVASPTLMVAGVDVLGEARLAATGCRLAVPDADQIRTAIRAGARRA